MVIISFGESFGMPDWEYTPWETDVPLLIQNAAMGAITPEVGLRTVSDEVMTNIPSSPWVVDDITVADLPFVMDAPELEPVPAIEFNYEAPTMDAFRELNPIDVALSVDWPDFVATAPVLDFGGEPGALQVDDPGQAPVLEDVALPDAPSYDLPTPPAIEDLALPVPPSADIPDFDRTIELADLPEVKAMDFVYQQYDSEMSPVIVAKLLARLLTGGTGLSAAAESAIFDQQLYRREQANEAAFDEMLNFFEGRGFSLPTGVMDAKAAQLTKARLRETSDISNSIMVEQAKLAKEDEQFILKTGIEFESLCRDFFIKENGIRLSAAKEVSENSIAILQAAIASNNALIAAYQAYAQVHEMKIKQALAKLEVFKAALEGVKLQAEIQDLRVKVYTSLLQGVLAQIEVYKGRMQGAALLMDIQKTKMEVYGKRVDVFTARVNAWATEWSGYKAKVEGQIARVQAFSAETQAFGTQVAAIKNMVEGYAAQKQVELNINAQRLQENQFILEKYKADLQGALGEADMELKVNTLVLQGYTAKLQGITAVYDAKYKAANALIEISKTRAGIAAEVSKLRVNLALGNLSASSEIKKTQLAGTATIRAALAGQTHMSGTASNSVATGVQMQAAYQKSFSQSQNKSASWSKSKSTNTSTINQTSTTNSDPD